MAASKSAAADSPSAAARPGWRRHHRRQSADRPDGWRPPPDGRRAIGRGRRRGLRQTRSGARLILQGLQADRLQVTRDMGIESPRPHRRLADELGQDQVRRPLERTTAGQQLVQDDAEAD